MHRFNKLLRASIWSLVFMVSAWASHSPQPYYPSVNPNYSAPAPKTAYSPASAPKSAYYPAPSSKTVYHSKYTYPNCAVPKKDVAPAWVHERRNLPPFSGVEVADNLRVVIYGDMPTQEVILTGNSIGVQQVSTEVVNGVLQIHAPCSNSSNPHYDGPPVVVKICMPRPLCMLATSGYVQLRGENIRSYGLTLCTKGASSVVLRGKITVQAIQADGSGNLDIPWTETSTLTVNGKGHSHVHVAGRTRVLNSHLSGVMCLEAENLQAEEVYVRTEDFAIAKVLPVFALYAFAGDNSNIYFYRKPPRLMRYSRQSGNILQVADR